MAEKTVLGSDKLRMVLEEFPEQCRKGLKLAEDISVKGEINKIFLLGMGGSALGGELLKTFLRESELPFFIVKDYSIPKYLNKDSIVFVVSYSGNTEETISAYKQAVKKTDNIVVLASGGKLVELSRAYKHTLIKLPEGLQPRFSYGLQFFSMLGVLRNSGVVQVKDSDITHAFILQCVS